MPKVMPVTIAVAAAVLAAPAVNAQVTSNRDTTLSPWPQAGRIATTAASADTAFVRQVIRSNATEVALGRLAESRAENSSVEDFAERMVTDHNAMNQEWGSLAREMGMRTTVDFGTTGEQTIERLEDLDGEEFDQAYMTEMIRHHEQDLAVLQRLSSSARSTEVRQLASTGSTTVRQHLALARQVGSSVGISTTAGRAGPVTTPLPAPTDDSLRRTTTTTTRTTTDRVSDEDRDARADREVARTLSREDRAFVEGILSDHLMHIRLAKRAERAGTREGTRELAESIEKDFSRWAERWERFADRRDAEVTSHLESQHRARIERLRKAADRKDLDHAYAAIVADHLEALIKDFRQEANEKRPGAVRRLIEDELPVLREHLAHARRLQAQERNQRD